MTLARRKSPAVFAILAGIAAAFLPLAGQRPAADVPKVPFDRYQLQDEIAATLKAWAAAYPKLAKLRSIGRSFEGRDLWLLEVTNAETGPGEAKPGFWIDGGTHPDEPCGTPMVMVAGQTLLAGFGRDPRLTELLNTRVFYILPRVNPDAVEHWLTQPGLISHAPPWDEDGDGLLDEDPAEDLNGDGAITLMRARDAAGPLKASKLDPRLLETRRETEPGEYRTWVEGRDNDGDGRFNEDGKGGINVNRNYPHDWNPAQGGAGPFPLSVPESRAVVEFLAAHPNITGCYSVHGGAWPVNFLVRPPANGPDESLPEFDLGVYETIGARFKEITGDIVESLYADTIMGARRRPGNYGYGLFLSWTYHALGLYSFTPEMCGIDADSDRDGSVSELEMLRWSDGPKGGRYFVDWKPYDHPQLGRVEIGGWVQKIAPIDAGLERICAQYAEFNLYQASLSPLLRIRTLKPESLGSGLFKIEAEVANMGFLPTYLSQAALTAKRDYPIIVELALENAELVTGAGRAVIGHLEGNAPRSPGYFLFSGGTPPLPSKRLEWVVRVKTGGAPRVTVAASAAKAGRDARTVELGGSK
jgi:hypothetical protein